MARSNSSTNPDRPVKKKDPTGTMRSKGTMNRLKMYKGKSYIRNAEGKIVDGDLTSKLKSGNKKISELGKMARVAPNRKWFGNTRVVGAKELDEFRTEMGKRVADPYSVILKRKKKRAKIGSTTMEELAASASSKFDKFEPLDDARQVAAEDKQQNEKSTSLIQDLFEKGQSKRIWTELYKVLDCSDVVIQVLDVRDPLGTRSKRVEDHLKKNAKHKSMIIVLNKVDLVPSWVTRKWVAILSQEYPTLAFHASITKPFGKGALIQLLRQFALLHSTQNDKKQISVGIIGYPNVGKSSLINTLSGQKVSHVSPVPGETKVWQYVTLFKKIYLIDCPGVVYESHDSEAQKVLKGVVRAEKLENPEEYIPYLLEVVRKEYLGAHYGCKPEELVDADAFLDAICRKRGRLRKGGELDQRTVAQSILYDLQRGKIPYFVPPPKVDITQVEEEEESEEEEENEETSTDTKKTKVRIEKQNFAEIPQGSFVSSGSNSVSWNELDMTED
ncbi:hypothetical protein BASA81_000022 [Batrachochytrium salamandrivorans]|nr:hypothetical protein BASA81_000022 [Batrachochytrium salamandrivorans]